MCIYRTVGAIIAASDAFLSWGWRIPFLLSAVLVGIGLYVRLNVTESPNPTSVLRGIGASLGAFAIQALMATSPSPSASRGGLTRSTVLWLLAAGSFVQFSPCPPTPLCPTGSAAAPS